MPTADQHPSKEYTKLLGMGESGTAKTGSLLSLLQAGYEIGVCDLDNGLDWLVNKLKKDHRDLLPKLSFQTFRDKRKMTDAGPRIDGIPKAYTRAIKSMEKWDDGTNPSEWGPKRIFVLDSLDFLGNAAYDWRDMLNPNAKDKRQIYGEAQEAIANILDALTSNDFHANVIVFTHMRWQRVVDAQGNSTIVKGGPASIGEALTGKIGTYFNSAALYETSGMGQNTKREITFNSTGLVDLKTSVVQPLPAKLPVATGLAEFFKAAQAD